MVNVRNPFSRLHSAFNDKMRNDSRHSEWISEAKPTYFQAISPFNTNYPPDDKFHKFSFNAFISYIDANPSEKNRIGSYRKPLLKPSKSISVVELRRSIAVFTTFLIDDEQVKSDWHWRSQYWHCSPCQFNYKYITHLQNSAEESNWLFREFGIENKTYLPGQYEQLPGQTEDRKHSEFYFRHMPKKLIKRIYREQFSRTVKRYF